MSVVLGLLVYHGSHYVCQVCFDQVNILTHTTQVPPECYQLEKIEKTRKNMTDQDLQELYGVTESDTERDLSSPFTDCRNIAVDEMSKTSCNDGTCKEISDAELIVYFFVMRRVFQLIITCKILVFIVQVWISMLFHLLILTVMLMIILHLMNLRYKVTKMSVQITLTRIIVTMGYVMGFIVFWAIRRVETMRELVVLCGIFSEEKILTSYKIILGNMPRNSGTSIAIL